MKMFGDVRGEGTLVSSRRMRGQEGFAIGELFMVVFMLVLLAFSSIFAFSRVEQRNKGVVGNDAVADGGGVRPEEAATVVVSAVESYRQSHSGRVGDMSGDDIGALYTPSNSVIVNVCKDWSRGEPNYGEYMVIARESGNSAQSYVYDSGVGGSVAPSATTWCPNPIVT